LRAERFACGQHAGEGEILELVQKNELEELYSELLSDSGLVFTSFSPRFSQGDPIRNNIT